MTWGSKDWNYYNTPWYNPLVGDVVVAYREYGDKETRTINIEYLCQGEVGFVEISGELVFDKGDEGEWIIRKQNN